MTRGEIWMYQFGAPDKRRPIVILTRTGAIGLLHSVIVSAVSRTVRGIPSEVHVGPENGLKHDSVVNLDQVFTVAKRDIVQFVGTLNDKQLQQVCKALAVAVDCECAR